MGMLSLKCFGVGDGWPCADRNHSAFLYRFGETSLLIDCGEPLSRTYKASGLSYNAFDRILISHLHADHTGGFFMFMQGLWLEKRTKPLTVHLPVDGIKPFREMLCAGMLFPELLPFRLRFEPLQFRRPITTGPVRVTPFLSSHLNQMRREYQRKYRQKFQAFCFLIEAGRLRIAHSADLGGPEDLAPLLAKPLDVLVCEVAHFPPEALFQYLRGRAIKRIVFVHLARPFWGSLKKTRQLAARMLGDIPCTFTRDGEEIHF
jgi:L-ascorbate metabolism protein UlaG (beta-lactamase superfamily)